MRTNYLAGETNKQMTTNKRTAGVWLKYTLFQGNWRQLHPFLLNISWNKVSFWHGLSRCQTDALSQLLGIGSLGFFVHVAFSYFFFPPFIFLSPLRDNYETLKLLSIKVFLLAVVFVCMCVFIKLSWAVPQSAAEVVLPGAKPCTMLLLWCCLQLLGWSVLISCRINLVGKGCFFFSVAVDIFKIIQVCDFWLYHSFCPLTVSHCSRPKWLLSYGQI